MKIKVLVLIPRPVENTVTLFVAVNRFNLDFKSSMAHIHYSDLVQHKIYKVLPCEQLSSLRNALSHSFSALSSLRHRENWNYF